MEWQQFKYFQTLARTQHMTRAAEELLITQPALSRSIARFEEEVEHRYLTGKDVPLY